jgi:hypothetical protein
MNEHSAGPVDAAAGLRASGRDTVEANGQMFVMRGANHPRVWYESQTRSFADIEGAGANTVRVVLGGGRRWGPSGDVRPVISLCKRHRLVCVLDVHDTTGYGEADAAASLDDAVRYWISQKFLGRAGLSAAAVASGGLLTGCGDGSSISGGAPRQTGLPTASRPRETCPLVSPSPTCPA